MYNYYFTFGSSDQFPYQNGYLIVKADNHAQAVVLFRLCYPDVHKNIYNASDSYNEVEWFGQVEKYYIDKKPFEIISLSRVKEEGGLGCCSLC